LAFGNCQFCQTASMRNVKQTPPGAGHADTLAGDHDQGAGQRGSGVDIDPQHGGDLCQQHVADHAAAHRGDRP